MPLPLDGIVQVSYRYAMCGQQLLNVLHYKVTDTGSGTVPEQLQNIADYMGATGVPDARAGGIITCIPSNCTLVECRAQLVHPFRTSYQRHEIIEDGLRGLSDTANVDVVITKRTDAAGRDQVSATHLPGIAQADMVEGLLDPDFKATVLDSMEWLAAEQLVAIADVHLQPVIWHQDLGGSNSAITNILVQNEVRVMVRRTVGRGE